MDQPGKRPARLLLAAQHQLRQPLNALSLLLGELREGAGRRETTAIVDDMRYALQLSNSWLEALVELESAEAGLVPFELQPVALQPLFAGLSDDFAPRLAALGLAFRIVPTSATVRADPVHLRRLLALLLDNAAKFTQSGKVLLGCRRSGGSLRIELWDSGPGLDCAQAAEIFEPFVRLDNEVRPRERGLGVGLAYARRLAQLTGDRLTVASQPGRGCCFHLTVQIAGGPAAGRTAPAGDAVLPNPLAGAEVLLLEGAEMVDLAARLASWGAAVRPVSPDALAAALAAAPKLLIAEQEDFAAAGGWTLGSSPGTVVVLLCDPAVAQTDPTGTEPADRAVGCAVHRLLRPVKAARLRSLCHFALTRAPQ